MSDASKENVLEKIVLFYKYLTPDDNTNVIIIGGELITFVIVFAVVVGVFLLFIGYVSLTENPHALRVHPQGFYSPAPRDYIGGKNDDTTGKNDDTTGKNDDTTGKNDDTTGKNDDTTRFIEHFTLLVLKYLKKNKNNNESTITKFQTLLDEASKKVVVEEGKMEITISKENFDELKGEYLSLLHNIFNDDDDDKFKKIGEELIEIFKETQRSENPVSLSTSNAKEMYDKIKNVLNKVEPNNGGGKRRRSNKKRSKRFGLSKIKRRRRTKHRSIRRKIKN